jgi:4-hydroxythreonine-4-phosphate dehydrogenase
MTHDNELHWAAQMLQYDGPCHEIHVLDNIWTVLVGYAASGERVPLSGEHLANAIAVLADVQRRAGKLGGRIAVCLPRDTGDSEEMRERVAALEAGVRLAISRGFIAAEGPSPAETLFARVRSGGLDGVITTHPDQEPVNATLMGYERGVTIFGGLPIVVTTTTHGTGTDIAGRGIANPWALRNAMSIALRIASG